MNPIINAMVDARFAEALAEAEAIDTELEGLDADERRERCRRQPFLGVPFSTKVMTLGVPISTKVNHLFPGLLPGDRPLLDSWFARQVSIKDHDTILTTIIISIVIMIRITNKITTPQERDRSNRGLSHSCRSSSRRWNSPRSDQRLRALHVDGGGQPCVNPIYNPIHRKPQIRNQNRSKFYSIP